MLKSLFRRWLGIDKVSRHAGDVACHAAAGLLSASQMIAAANGRADVLERRLEAIEGHLALPSSRWFAQMVVGATTVVGLEIEGDFEERSPSRVRITSIASATGRKLPVAEVVEQIRRVYGCPEVVMPRTEEIDWVAFEDIS